MRPFTRFLLHDARPYTLLISSGSVMFGLVAAVIRGGVSLFPAFMTLLFAILLQISANLYHGYIDFSKILKENVGFRTLVREYPGINESNVRLLSAISKGFAILAATAGLPLFTFVGWIGVLYVAVILVILYFTFEGPHPLARTPWSLVVTFLIFGPITVSGTVLIQDFDSPQWLPVVVYSMLSGLMACNAHIAIQYLKLQEDMGRSKRTLLIATGFKTARNIYIFNSFAVAIILNLRPCMEGLVDQWVPILLGIALITSTFIVIKYMSTHSPRYAKTITQTTQAQYIVFILIILIIVVNALENFKFNIFHLV